jgi:hypothetical protein
VTNIETVVLAHMQRSAFASVEGIARQRALPRSEVAKALAALAERQLIVPVGNTRWFTRTDFAA